MAQHTQAARDSAGSQTGRGINPIAWVLTCAALLAVPALGLWMTRVSIANFEATWLHDLAAANGPIPADRLAAVQLPVVCADPGLQAQFSDYCGNLTLASVLDGLGLVTLVVAIGLIAILLIANLSAPRLGPNLGRVFRPGLLGLLVGLLILLGAGSIVVVGGAYTTELSSTGLFHPYFVVIGAVTGLALIVGSLNALFAFLEPPLLNCQAIPVDRVTQPRLFLQLDQLAARIGTETPNTVVVGLQPNFWVTELPVSAFDQHLYGRTMYLSLPLCRILEVDEFEAVLGHELAHFHGGDTKLSRNFYPVYIGSRSAYAAYLATRGGFASVISLLPANVLALFFIPFERAEKRLSRQRELAADAHSAATTSPIAAGAALLKLTWHAGKWPVLEAEGVRKILWGHAPGNQSAQFASFAGSQSPPAQPETTGGPVMEHPTDTHPPVEVRVEHLGGAAEADARARVLPAARPAIAVFDNPEVLELRLVKRIQGLVAARLRVEPSIDPTSPAGPSAAALREAASGDPFIGGVVDRIQHQWGPDLVRPHQPRNRLGHPRRSRDRRCSRATQRDGDLRPASAHRDTRPGHRPG